MPNTPIYGLPFETPQTKPGITLTGDADGSAPILAEAVESILASFEARLTSIETTGYRLYTTLYFTSGATAFTKSSYPGFKAARVRMVGGGGGGGGAEITSGTQLSAGSGGGGGCYAESFLLSSAIASSVTVTVGAGGVGGTAAVVGTAGGTSSFGTLVTAGGGAGGIVETTTGANGVSAGAGGTSGTGDLIIPGSDGNNVRNSLVDTVTESPKGGTSIFGGARTSSSTVGGSNGIDARNYGAGGSGAMNDDTEVDPRTGGNGSAGLVIVDVFI
jgi:hypothetical protein